MGRRKRRRKKPEFPGFGQLRAHPVLVGLSRDLAPRPEQATGGIVVHELESAPVAVGAYSGVPLGAFAPVDTQQNPDLSGVTSFGGMSMLASQGGVLTRVGGRGPSAPAGGGGGGGGGRPGGRPGGRGRHRRRRHGPRHRPLPWWWWSWTPYYAAYGSWGPGWRPGLPLPGDCQRPLSADCTRFRVTRQWAAVCFMAAYNRMRQLYGANLGAITNAIVELEAPGCGSSQTNPAQEFRRRVELASAVLLRSEGINVPMPPAPPGPRPPSTATYQQPWMRALLTGWV